MGQRWFSATGGRPLSWLTLWQRRPSCVLVRHGDTLDFCAAARKVLPCQSTIR
jgi:hypothetical protein